MLFGVYDIGLSKEPKICAELIDIALCINFIESSRVWKEMHVIGLTDDNIKKV